MEVVGHPPMVSTRFGPSRGYGPSIGQPHPTRSDEARHITVSGALRFPDVLGLKGVGPGAVRLPGPFDIPNESGALPLGKPRSASAWASK